MVGFSYHFVKLFYPQEFKADFSGIYCVCLVLFYPAKDARLPTFPKYPMHGKNISVLVGIFFLKYS